MIPSFHLWLLKGWDIPRIYSYLCILSHWSSWLAIDAIIDATGFLVLYKLANFALFARFLCPFFPILLLFEMLSALLSAYLHARFSPLLFVSLFMISYRLSLEINMFSFSPFSTSAYSPDRLDGFELPQIFEPLQVEIFGTFPASKINFPEKSLLSACFIVAMASSHLANTHSWYQRSMSDAIVRKIPLALMKFLKFHHRPSPPPISLPSLRPFLLTEKLNCSGRFFFPAIFHSISRDTSLPLFPLPLPPSLSSTTPSRQSPLSTHSFHLHLLSPLRILALLCLSKRAVVPNLIWREPN